MKIPPLPLVCLGALLFSSSLQAAKHKKHASGQAPATAPSANSEAAPTVNRDDLPSVTLQPFLDTHLGLILDTLDKPGYDRPEIITSLKSAYADGMATAPPTRRAAYQAAQNVCDLLSSAMVERQQAAAALTGSRATHSSEIEQPRGGRNQAKAEVHNTDDFFMNSQKNNWVQRAAVLRQNVMALYLRERAFERQSLVPAPAPAPAPQTTGNASVPPVAAPTPSVSAPPAAPGAP